jgi:hypothetical protein
MKPMMLACAELLARAEEKNACWSLVGKRERKRPFLENSHRWQDNVKLFLKEGGTRLY